ncbi:MAG: DUF4367 domain-containing protein [Alistipes senegalensis]|nr:DUF4367 domain-containing protein [Alistipes senegalensis]
MAVSNFQKALYNALAPEYEMAMQDVANEHEFSTEFEKNMKKLINRRNKPYYKIINTAGKRTACAAVVVLVVSSVTIMNVEALRNAFSDFFVSIYEKFSTVQPVEDDTSPTTLEEIYEITYNLNGFEIIYDEHDEYSNIIHYNKDNIVIYFKQCTKNMYDSDINTENAKILTVDINGHEAIYFIDNNDYYHIIWDNGDYIISLSSNISENTLIEIAKSVQKVE